LHQLKNLLVNSLLNSVLDLLLNLHPENLGQSQSNQNLKKEYMTEPNQEIQNQLQTDFEEAIAEKNKTIYRLEQERNSALSARAKMEKEVDDLKADKQSALDKAERAEARYLRNTELKAKSQVQETNLLNTLFGGAN